MINNTPLLTLLLFSLTVLFSNCKKDPCADVFCQNGAVCEQGVCECPTGYTGEFCEQKLHLLKRMIFVNNVQYEFFYDSKNRMKQRLISNNNFILSAYNYFYHEDSIHVEIIDHQNLDTIQYYFNKKNSNELETVQINPSGNTTIGRYFNLNSTCGYTTFYKGSFLGEIEYSQDCDLSIKYFKSDTLFSSREIIIDDSNYVFQTTENSIVDLNTPFFTNKKNILKDFRYNSQGEIGEAASYESEFELNNDNYPIREIRTYLNGTSIEIQFEYY